MELFLLIHIYIYEFLQYFNTLLKLIRLLGGLIENDGIDRNSMRKYC